MKVTTQVIATMKAIQALGPRATVSNVSGQTKIPLTTTKTILQRLAQEKLVESALESQEAANRRGESTRLRVYETTAKGRVFVDSLPELDAAQAAQQEKIKQRLRQIAGLDHNPLMVLLALYELLNKGTLPYTETIVAHTDMKQQAIYRALRKLVQDGLIVPVKPLGSRNSFHQLTKKGNILMAKLQAVLQEARP